MPYRCVATSPEGLVQQVAVSYLRHGYWYYVTGRIPICKDPELVDRKILDKYQIAISERERCRRKRRGVANLQYIRHQSWFVILATDGHHPFKQQERDQIRDVRRVPIKFEGYSISYRRCGQTPVGGGPPKWRSCVRIDSETYRELKAFFLERACRRPADRLAIDFGRVPYARYSPVRRQLLMLLRLVNKSRSKSGFSVLPASALMLRREIVSPFGDTKPERPDEDAPTR